jgi:uncharacterized DUF497 family protein
MYHLRYGFSEFLPKTKRRTKISPNITVSSGNLLIDEIIWQQQFVEKLATKHGVEKTEVEEVLTNRPRFRFVSKGNRSDEDVYSAMGQTDAGRYLIVFFIQKPNRRALIISARDMTRTERSNYGRQR